VSSASPACAGAGSCCWRSRTAGRRRSSRPPLAPPGSPSPACRLGSDSPNWRSVPSAPASRLVPVATPSRLAAPRTTSPRIRRGQDRRGAPLPSGPRQRGPAARRCPLPSQGQALLPRRFHRVALVCSPAFAGAGSWLRDSALHAGPSGQTLLWPLLTPPRPSDAVADTPGLRRGRLCSGCPESRGGLPR